MSVVLVLAGRSTKSLKENILCLKNKEQTTVGTYSRISDSIISTTSDSSEAKMKLHGCQQVHRTRRVATLLRKTARMTMSCSFFIFLEYV